MKIKVKTKKRILKVVRLMMIISIISTAFGIGIGIRGQAFADSGDLENAIETGFDTVAQGAIWVGISLAFGGIPFLIFTAVKLVIVAIGLILQILMSGVYSSLESSLDFVSLEDIIFAGANDRSVFLDIDFFDMSAGVPDTVITFREAIAKWYYILRLISVAVLLVVLIYVGIRMALSTIASEQAKYKQMLVDWVTGTALMFLLHYIIMFVITINSTFVNALSGLANDIGNEASITGVLFGGLENLVWAIGIQGIFMAVIYLIFVGQIFSFFLLYMKRMITVGFLVMIAPLIIITYSIDKIGDGKAQALNAWLKELVYNILIQPFHCIIYLAFFDAIANMIQNNTAGIGAYVFAILVMQFMKKAEDILKKIFHFEASSMSSLSESGQNIMNATGKFTKMGLAAGSAVSSFKASGGIKGMKQNWQQFKNNVKSKSDLRKEFNTSKVDSEGKTVIDGRKYDNFRDFKKSAEGKDRLNEIKATNATEMKAKQEAKRQGKIDKNREKYNKKHGDDPNAYDNWVEERAKKEYDRKHGGGKWQELKDKANERDKSGNLTDEAKEAQKKIDSSKETQHDKIIKEGGSTGPLRKIAGATTVPAGKVFSGMREFANNPDNKLIMDGLKSSAKVASAIGMGAFAYGATGELNDAISAGQASYGFTKGMFENTTKTVAGDTVQKANQLAEVNGIDPKNEDEMKNLVLSIKAESDAGLLDSKAITSKLEQLENAIRDNGGNKEILKNVRIELTSAMQQGTLTTQRIQEIINRNCDTMSDSAKAEVESSAKGYVDISFRASIAKNIDTLQNTTGMSSDTAIDTVINKMKQDI